MKLKKLMKPRLVLNRLKALFEDQTAYSGSETKPFRVLIGTVLSARTKDQTTATAAERLFAVYDTAEKLATASLPRIRRLIYPVGFYRTKAKTIKKLAKELLRFGGVPDAMEELIKLPGVGRKTASCVLNYAFAKPAIAVDVHVQRISNRLGLVKTKTPEETEEALKRLYPQRHWRYLNNLFVLFGQNLCLPRSPRCSVCVLNELCPSRHAVSELPLKVRFKESQNIVAKSWRGLNPKA